MSPFARAKWAYTAIEDNEISFGVGDMIEVLELCNDDWFEGRIGTTIGYFPANRVEILRDHESHAEDAHKDDTIMSAAAPTNVTSTEPNAEEKPKAAIVGSGPADLPSEDNAQNEASETSGNENPFSDDLYDGAGGSEISHEDVEREEEVAELVGEDPNSRSVSTKKEEADDSWKELRNEQGETYYWNETTNATTWEKPASSAVRQSVAGHSTGAIDIEQQLDDDEDDHYNESKPISVAGHDPEDNATSNFDPMERTSQLVDTIPNDMILREGAVKRKMKKDVSGKEPRSQATWKACYAVACVGFLIFFRDAPSKSKKSSSPLDIVHLSNIAVETAGKEQTSKKNVLMLTLENGRQWLILPDSDASPWIDVLRAATKERVTPAEFEGATSRLFGRAKSESDLLSNGAAGIMKARRSTSAGKEKDASSTLSDGSKNQVRSKITSFFTKKPLVSKKDRPVTAITEVDAIDGIFGGLLEIQLDREQRKIPLIVELCCAEVDKRGLESQGIYRLSGNSASIQKLRTSFNQMEVPPLDSEELDINVVTGLLKLYFRELQNPLIPYEFYDQFIASAKIDDYNNRLIAFKTLVQSLPVCNYQVLEYLIRHLCKVAGMSEINKMEQSNLAIVFAPTLIRPQDDGSQPGLFAMSNITFHNTIMEALLEQCNWIFDGAED